MKKLLGVVVVILILAAAVMPFVSGLVMEKGVRRCIADLNTMYADTGTDISFEIVRYDRGFRSSEVEYRVNMGSMKTIYGVEQIVVIDRAKHGYTGVVSTSSLEGNSWYTGFVNEKLGGNEPLSLTTEYSLNGKIRSVLTILPVSFMFEQETVEVQGGEFVLHSDWKLDHARVRGSWGGARAADKVALEGFSCNSDLRKISTFIWEGDFSMEVDRMLANEGGTSMDMQKMQADYRMKYNEARDTLAVEAIYGFGQVTDGMESIEDGRVVLGARNLDGAAYEEAMRLYMDLVGNLLTDVAAMEDDPEMIARVLEEKMIAIGMQVMAIYEKFLKSGLELYVDGLYARLPEGEVKGGLNLRLEKDLTLVQMLPMANDPEMLFDFISLKSDFSMPASLVPDNRMLLTPLIPGMQTGLFRLEGDKLVHSAETKEKQMFLNGARLSFN